MLHLKRLFLQTKPTLSDDQSHEKSKNENDDKNSQIYLPNPDSIFHYISSFKKEEKTFACNGNNILKLYLAETSFLLAFLLWVNDVYFDIATFCQFLDFSAKLIASNKIIVGS